MSKFLINPSSISFDSVLKNLKDYIDTKPESAAWKDFYESSAGQTHMEFIAGFGTYLTFTIIANRRETYLFHAEHKSAAIAIVEGLGYSAFRGRNIRVALNITASSTEIISKLSLLGVHGDYDIISLEDTVINSGETKDINVIIGTLKTEELTIDSPNLKIFRFISPLVSDDIVLTLNSAVLPISKNIPDLLEDFYVYLSNAVGGIDIMYLNDTEGGQNPYGVGDTLLLTYVERKETIFSEGDVDFFYGDVNSFEVLNAFELAETRDKLRVSGPLHHETQKLVRGRDDYKKLLLQHIPNSISTNAHDDSPAVVSLTYVLADLSLLNSTEKEDILVVMNTFRPFGVEMAGIVDPTQIGTNLDVTITLNSSLDVVGFNQINSDVQAVLNEYKYELGEFLDLEQIEHELENKSYVKIARVKVTNGQPVQLAWDQYFEIVYHIELI